VKPINNYIQQMNLFSLQDLFQIEEKTRLELIFANIDLTPVIKSLRNNSKKGPKGYDIKAIIRAF
jgi:hypothetical protein